MGSPCTNVPLLLGDRDLLVVDKWCTLMAQEQSVLNIEILNVVLAFQTQSGGQAMADWVKGSEGLCTQLKASNLLVGYPLPTHCATAPCAISMWCCL
mmetsp:Transcript_72854/g.122092  ORF Transcript_72854/g.122092 Transcript_72854/m.122092 type:complete len:97 (-) Transcript_72854:100-390(-)